GAHSGSRTAEADPAGLDRLRSSHRRSRGVHVRAAARSAEGAEHSDSRRRPSGVSLITAQTTIARRLYCRGESLWRSGRLLVRRKGRREAALPLTFDLCPSISLEIERPAELDQP